MQFMFGSGILWGTPLTDANGASIANPTPVQLGILQDTSIDLTYDIKELYGQSQFPVAVGRGKGKMTGKAKIAQVNGTAINSLFFGQTTTAGLVSDYYDVAGAAIPASPYQVTIAPPSSGTWSYDLGVRDSDGLPMTRVASTPVTGQYSVAAGVYTFAAADTGKSAFISYQYTSSSTTAVKSTVKNLVMGQAPTFKADFYFPYAGKSMILTVPNCVASQFMIATKQDDFVIPEFNFTGFADSAGNALYYSTTDK